MDCDLNFFLNSKTKAHQNRQTHRKETIESYRKKTHETTKNKFLQLRNIGHKFSEPCWAPQGSEEVCFPGRSSGEWGDPRCLCWENVVTPCCHCCYFLSLPVFAVELGHGLLQRQTWLAQFAGVTEVGQNALRCTVVRRDHHCWDGLCLPLACNGQDLSFTNITFNEDILSVFKEENERSLKTHLVKGL